MPLCFFRFILGRRCFGTRRGCNRYFLFAGAHPAYFRYHIDPVIKTSSCNRGGMYVSYIYFSIMTTHAAEMEEGLLDRPCILPVPHTLGVNDNSIKMWVLDDSADGSNTHLLRLREGHSAPPRTIRFYSNFGTAVSQSVNIHYHL